MSKSAESGIDARLTEANQLRSILIIFPMPFGCSTISFCGSSLSKPSRYFSLIFQNHLEIFVCLTIAASSSDLLQLLFAQVLFSFYMPVHRLLLV